MNHRTISDDIPPSLFVVSLPRSLSTDVYQACVTALSMRSPRWTSEGEILNGERMVLFSDRLGYEALKFTPPEDHRYRAVLELLDDLVIPRGYAYKDVVHPFVVAEWLSRTRLPVLRIRRPIADVAWAMLKRGWLYPREAASSAQGDDDMGKLVTGLRRASEALDRVPCKVVDFDALIQHEDTLPAALERLYPQVALRSVRLLNDRGRAQSEQVLRRRETPLWRMLERLSAAVG